MNTADHCFCFVLFDGNNDGHASVGNNCCISVTYENCFIHCGELLHLQVHFEITLMFVVRGWGEILHFGELICDTSRNALCTGSLPQQQCFVE